MSGQKASLKDLHDHVLRMRWTAGGILATVPVAVVLCFVVPHRGGSAVSPMAVTLIAAAASLWIGFSANRDATHRLERIRRAAAVHNDERRLLRDHWLVYLAVLVRLEVMIVGGLVIALWGSGPWIGVWAVVLGGLMIVLTWPTMRKTQLLLGRARVLREGNG